jgi:tryptophan synthase alpha chain
MGSGIPTPQQAVEAAAAADGVVVASALMRAVLDGASVVELGAAVADIRRALDRG